MLNITNLSNLYACNFQQPQEAVQTKSNRNVSDIFKCHKKISVNKWPNCPFQNPSVPYKLVFGSEEDDLDEQEI